MALIKPCKIKIDLYDTFCERVPEYTQYDRNIPLEVTVTAKGEETDITEWRARIGVSKPDGTRVYREDLTVEGNVIKTRLTEQVFAVAGMVEIAIDLVDEESTKVSLHRFYINVKPSVITDEVIKSSNDYQTIVNLIKEVRDIETTFEQEQRDRAEAFEEETSERGKEWQGKIEEYDAEFRLQMNSQRDTFNQSQSDRTRAFNQQMETQQATFEEEELERNRVEQTRRQQEQARETAEVKRETAEGKRQTAETERMSKETEREQAEVSRVNAEAQRKLDEGVRQTSEDERKVNEVNRQSAEEERVTAEANRKNVENDRVTKESQRQIAESNRATAETRRNNAEQTRQTKEMERQSAEQTRQTKEQERQVKEQERITAEQGRIDAETERNERMTEFESRAEQMAVDLEIQTQRIEEYVNTNEERLIDSNDKVDYMGNQHESLKAKNDADIDWLLGEVNTVHYEGQHITATDTFEKQVKSAILKGQTLVNLIKDGYMASSTPNPQNAIASIMPLDGSKEYTLMLNKNLVQVNIRFWYTDGSYGEDYAFSHRAESGYIKNKLRIDRANATGKTLENIQIYSVDANGEITNMMLLEGDYTNVDIPYFTGMQSVKMPVLTTTGKNLFDGKYHAYKYVDTENGILRDSSDSHATDFILIRGFESISCSNEGYEAFAFYNENKIFIMGGFGKKLEVPKNAYYVRFTIKPTDNLAKFMVVEGSLLPPYEPYKSNILTANEPIELRGIGDVRDELDCLTRQVTERIGEVVLDGSENWGLNNTQTTTTNRFILNGVIKSDMTDATLSWYMVDKLPKTKWSNSCQLGITLTNGMIFLYNNSIEYNISALKSWLSQNPITVQYELAEPTIKTVDLSDNHVYSYKDVTHYDCSSAEGSLVPTLSIDVPTNLPALVSRQRETIKGQENKISDLQVENELLKQSQGTQDSEIITNMLASVELFEMVLGTMPNTVNTSESKGVNPMIEVYVTLILKGEKTIEQVPMIIRDKVQQQLDLLTK